MEYDYVPDDFRDISYKLHGTREATYYYERSAENEEYFNSLNEIYGDNLNWQRFETLTRNGEIRIFKKPKTSYLGWFLKDPTFGDDLLYSFDRYKYLMGKKLAQNNKSFRDNKRKFYKDEKTLELEEEEELKKRPAVQYFRSKKSFKNNFPKIIDIYKNFMTENDQQLNNLLDHYLKTQNYSENELHDLMIEEAKRKYNFEKDRYNENVRNYNNLSLGMKQQTQEMGKHLDKFLLKLKPIFLDYKSRNSARDKYLNEEFLKREEQEMKKIREEEAQEKQKYEEEIENLEYKIRDAESRYSMNRAKLRKLVFRVNKLEKLEKQKSILEDKIKNTNLKISERKILLEQKTQIDEKLKSLDSLKSQVANLKSKIPDLSVFEQEKILRQRELDNLKKLNETSLRTKNANLRSLELEKKRQEIAILEEQRYQQQKQQEEELKQLKIVFLKEKKITQKRIDQLKWESKSRKIKLQNTQKINLDLQEQKQKLQQILAEKSGALRDKKLQIERKKIQTLEIKKREALEKSEQQKLFSDSLKRDVDELEIQKQLLSEISDNNKKILESTKQEISSRQKEIEKTISLNMESARKNASEIYAREAQMKLDVFQSLNEVKNQAAIKTDVNEVLENLKDEILRKESVSSLLSETIDSITNNEISDIENYNNYLESEIKFKKKLADENLTLAEKQEALNDEREDVIDRLEYVKSQKMKKIYETREAAIEQQMKILLIEGAEDLKNNLFSLKYEIENLEAQKEISERKEDLVKFQSDNAKKELKLRRQEIELLKNIRVQVLETERIVIRNETKLAIQDMVKSVENEVHDSEVREKLDEILDDVEIREISRQSKASLFSVIDKIENKEIHDQVKDQINVILKKIELNEDVENYKKNIKNFLEQLNDHKIQDEVDDLLEDIIDKIEYGDDYDFLQDDDLEKFFEDVRKKAIIAAKEKFEKIEKNLPKIREEDSKLKMDENIEMKDRNPPPETSEGVGETSFDEFSDYNFFINNIEDPVLKEKTRTFLGNIDGFETEEEKILKSKNAYKSAINSALWEDQLDLNYWDGNIILDEKAKFLYEQKVKNINTALGVDYDIHIDPTDMRIREFLDIKLTETFSDKRQEINGYTYNGEKIISRNISRNFFFNYLKKPAACQRFIDELKEVINKTAKSQIASESYFEGKSVKDCAVEYIGELREEQSYQIDSARNGREMRDALREANDIDKEIKNIKKNSSFKMRLKIFRRTLSWRITKLLRPLWKHKGKSATIIGSLILAGIGVLLNQLGVIAVVHNLKKAARSVKQYANDVHEMGKRIIHNIQSLYGIPGKILGYSMILFGIVLRVLYFFTRISGTASSSIVFGVFGTLIEISLFFSGNIETINEKAAEVLEETGNIIENAGIRSQKYIAKNMPRWYYDIPKEERTILQHIEAGAANVIFKVAKGTQYTGKKVQDAGETMKKTIFYIQAFMVVIFALLVLNFIRNYLL